MSAASHQQELERISATDSLTGIYNRRHMEQKIQEEYSGYQRTGSEFALILADIDYFKNINDVFGHDCGDNLLKLIVNDISSTVRANDTVARWGGEEFLLLLPVTNKDHAVKLAERIRKTVEGKKYDTGIKLVSATLTMGVSVVRLGDTPDGMIKRADLALYHGKRKSRNCVILFDEKIM